MGEASRETLGERLDDVEEVTGVVEERFNTGGVAVCDEAAPTLLGASSRRSPLVPETCFGLSGFIRLFRRRFGVSAPGLRPSPIDSIV